MKARRAFAAMNLALVARGPTRCRIIGREREFDRILCVNDAAALHACDWWVFGDAETYWKVTPAGEPRWFTNQRTLDRIHAATPTTWDALGVQGPNRNPCECCFSGVAALYLAKHMGAARVTCFGVVDEFAQPGESPRWGRERTMWNDAAERMGLSIVRA